jgi:hypothetical protein
MNGRTAKQIRRMAMMTMVDEKNKDHRLTMEPRYKKNSITGQVALFGCFKAFIVAVKKMKKRQEQFILSIYTPTRFSKTMKIWQSGKNKKSKRVK